MLEVFMLGVFTVIAVVVYITIVIDMMMDYGKRLLTLGQLIFAFILISGPSWLVIALLVFSVINHEPAY